MSVSTYTSPYGTTQQGTGVQSLQDAISSLQQIPNPAQAAQQASGLLASATANYPQYASQQATALTNQAQLPQLSGQYNLSMEDFNKMHVADQQFAQQYGNQNAQAINPSVLGAEVGPNTPSANPASGNVYGTYTSPQGVVFAAPEATYQNIADPSQAVMSQDTKYSLAGQDVSALTNRQNEILKIIANNLGKMQSQYAINTGEYSSLVNALQGNVNTDLSLAQLGEQGRQFDLSRTLTPGAMSGEVERDASNGMTLTQMLDKYSGYIDPSSVFAIYNRYNKGYNASGKFQKGKGGWGDVHETPEQLQGMGITLPASYTKQRQGEIDQLKAAQGIYDAASNMMNAYSSISSIPGLGYLLQNIPGAGHLVPGVAQAQSILYSQLPNLRRGSIGGRITQREITWLTQNLLPSPLDTPAVMQSKLGVLQDEINRFTQDPNFTIGSNYNYGQPKLGSTQKGGGDPLNLGL